MREKTKMSKTFYDSFNSSDNKGFTFMLQVSWEGRKEGNSYGVEKEF